MTISDRNVRRYGAAVAHAFYGPEMCGSSFPYPRGKNQSVASRKTVLYAGRQHIETVAIDGDFTLAALAKQAFDDARTEKRRWG
ncbi:hypothetical protein KCP71_01885 [Salmonella enterica subsp. enterica]|nr:hypothetical protein KCP71_01885 [Salmonella enterica subsp. enterica]